MHRWLATVVAKLSFKTKHSAFPDEAECKAHFAECIARWEAEEAAALAAQMDWDAPADEYIPSASTDCNPQQSGKTSDRRHQLTLDDGGRALINVPWAKTQKSEYLPCGRLREAYLSQLLDLAEREEGMQKVVEVERAEAKAALRDQAKQLAGRATTSKKPVTVPPLGQFPQLIAPSEWENLHRDTIKLNRLLGLQYELPALPSPLKLPELRATRQLVFPPSAPDTIPTAPDAKHDSGISVANSWADTSDGASPSHFHDSPPADIMIEQVDDGYESDSGTSAFFTEYDDEDDYMSPSAGAYDDECAIVSDDGD